MPEKHGESVRRVDHGRRIAVLGDGKRSLYFSRLAGRQAGRCTTTDEQDKSVSAVGRLFCLARAGGIVEGP